MTKKTTRTEAKKMQTQKKRDVNEAKEHVREKSIIALIV